MRINFRTKNYQITFSTTAKRKFWGDYHHGALKDGIRHFVWWRFSLYIEDLNDPHYSICAVCQSLDIGERGFGDESWTVCQDCQSVEQGYEHLTLLECENRGIEL